jgi:hypothetical protein
MYHQKILKINNLFYVTIINAKWVVIKRYADSENVELAFN